MFLPDFDFYGHPAIDWVTQPELFWQPLSVLGLWIFIRYFLVRRTAGIFSKPSYGIQYWLQDNTSFIILFILLSLGAGIGQLMNEPFHFIEFIWTLIGLWLILALLAAHFRDRITAKILAILLFPFIAIGTLGNFKKTIAFLDDFTLDLISPNISALQIITGILVLVIALWISLVGSRWIGRKIEAAPILNSSIKVLLAKILRIVLVSIAFLMAISAMGLNLTVFAFLGGGIGIGIGFGLQKVVSNLVCGFILLGDKSIKPGDVVQIGGVYAGGPKSGGVYGWVNNLRARYISVITRDGTEHLIPNEDFITQPVINWSFSHNLVRLHVLLHISYRADVHKAIALVNQAATSVERVVDDPKPKCLLVSFSDSALMLEARFWIQDPQNGVTRVKSAVRLAAWDLFREHGIKVPYPQRDLHIKPPANIAVTLNKETQSETAPPTSPKS